ncbi:triose-phosphate isomerase [Inhella gelatinilytica]|uniref:Triosephosphate isomerase n=1 Tax=Inhella gelatinilytica TaxID=2795030 RepID=A0A931NFR4_9BURK|nr:triose-phosphate isomerase [Inhella gelatinilytica]MBH9553821.1 triose-phosphate isomerase [Inhella gelatinilytica]
MRKTLVVGNWKMHGGKAFVESLLSDLKSLGPWSSDVVVCPPLPYLAQCERLLSGSPIAWGSQDVSAHNGQGAYTGEVSATLLKEFGARYAIVGHSERRTYHAENDQLVAAKAKAALAQDLIPIVCVGETRAEREAGHTEAVVQRQLGTLIRNLGARIGEVVVAYEPVWAIGTGLTATPEQAQEVHARLRQQLLAATPAAAQVRILYGGSVKPENAAQLFSQPDIDGGLIGGAALKAADFDAICRAGH